MRWSCTFNSPPTCGEGVAGWTAVLWAVVDWELGVLGWIFNQSAGHCAVVLEWQQSSNLNMSHCKSWEQKLTEFMATTPWPRKWLFMAANKFNFLVNNVKQFSSILPPASTITPLTRNFERSAQWVHKVAAVKQRIHWDWRLILLNLYTKYQFYGWYEKNIFFRL